MTLAQIAVGYLWVAMGFTAVGLVFAARDAGRQTRRKDRPKPRDFSQARGWLTFLLKSGYGGGTVALIDENSQRRIEFSKQIQAKGDYGIWLHVPADAAWAGPEFSRVRALSENIGVAGQTVPSTDQGRQAQFSIDFRRDAEKAHTLALSIWTKIFDRSLDDPCKIEARDVSFAGDLIDSADEQPPWSGRAATREDALRQILPSIKRKTGLSIVGHVLFIPFTAALVVSLFALPATTIHAYAGVPDWSVEIIGLTIRGSNAGLAWLVTGCLSFTGLTYLRRKRPERRTERSRLERLFRLGFRFVAATMVLAVLVVWTDQ